MNKKKKKRGDAPRKLTPFERETERRRREMLRSLGDRTQPIQNKRLKSLLWQGAAKEIVHGVMRAKPVRRAPRGS